MEETRIHAETKFCPKCGSKFECNNYNILKCDCVLVHLSGEARQRVSEKYDDCLCVNCLREFAGIASAKPG